MSNLSSEQIYLQKKDSLNQPTVDISQRMGKASDSDVKRFNEELSSRKKNSPHMDFQNISEQTKSLLEKKLIPHGDGILKSKKEKGNLEGKSQVESISLLEEDSDLEADSNSMTALREASPFLASIMSPVSVSYKPVTQSKAPLFAKLLEKLVNQMLVAEAQGGTTQEIQLSLKDSVLAGSTIQMVRDGDELNIQFITLNEEMADLVRENVGVLREGLYEKLNLKSVRVDVHTQEEARDSSQEKEKDSRNSHRERQQ